jgi:hypothetical protein
MQIRIVGAYLPRLDQAGISAFIEEDVEDFRQGMRDLRRRGITDSTDEKIDQQAKELPAELDADLQTCALFEAEVLGNDAVFDPAYFESDSGFCGWEPVFLALDGESIILKRYEAPAELKNFRVAFYIHLWSEQNKLKAPNGIVMNLPPFAAVPERLWKLAPYRCVD